MKLEIVKIDAECLLTASRFFGDLTPSFFDLVQTEKKYQANINKELFDLSKEQSKGLKKLILEKFKDG